MADLETITHQLGYLTARVESVMTSLEGLDRKVDGHMVREEKLTAKYESRLKVVEDYQVGQRGYIAGALAVATALGSAATFIIQYILSKA